MADELYFRTEDIRPRDIPDLFVATKEDRGSVDLLKAQGPVILEGSRGTGKSFLLRVAEAEQLRDLESEGVFPVYVPFLRSSLIHTDDPNQFRHWMLAKTCHQIIRSLRKAGRLRPRSSAVTLLAGGELESESSIPRLAAVETLYEESWKTPPMAVSTVSVPDVDELKEAVEDLCDEQDLERICLYFDEAAHIMRPEQQRQFFTLFRDLRSPYITCNAAVYPGVTAYGESFELAHDATLRRIGRDVTSPDYVDNMREIVLKQAGDELSKAIATQGQNFSVLAYAVHGNPRFLLKTIARLKRLRTRDVEETIKDFYRTDIWAEHTSLGKRYAGHRPLVDWGRDFIESAVLKDTQAKNESRKEVGRDESTCYFWVHRDAPASVWESLRLLEYTGLVHRGDSGIRATRRELGTRYAVTLGCLFAIDASPVAEGIQVSRNLSIKRFTEYGAAHAAFGAISQLSHVHEPDMQTVLKEQLGRSIERLDLTAWQKGKLAELGVATVGDILRTTEQELIDKIYYVHTKRARQIMNAATNAVLEYLSG